MTTTTTTLTVHALRTELDPIEAKAVAEARDLTPTRPSASTRSASKRRRCSTTS
jgi:hypothetical protein